ncbi:hypothetical protein QWM81_02755 [Streptomyces ficellus]|uniref:Uncharacterized protein n=1 Tax=Streptomyces ficellus TaxID=1977088 RepID=A0ABT7Z0H4_9ACTN|nr:hypothetical protein [Streptomyces ficellus]MDN3292986.1 hypothetical protein [Streptomyces ficellus]
MARTRRRLLAVAFIAAALTAGTATSTVAVGRSDVAPAYARGAGGEATTLADNHSPTGPRN